jgi:hypothetical protein
VREYHNVDEKDVAGWLVHAATSLDEDNTFVDASVTKAGNTVLLDTGSKVFRVDISEVR